MIVPALLAARLRHAPGRRLMVAAGIAACTALAVLSQAVALLTADAALRTVVAGLPAGERSVIVSYNGAPAPAELAAMDALVAGTLPGLGAAVPSRQMAFREIASPGGATFVLSARDGVAGAVRLVSGRLPAACTPRRCEVVELVVPGARALPPLDPALGVVVVGTALRTDPLLLTGTFAAEPGVPVLVAEGVRGAAGLESLALFGRSYGWVQPLDLDRVQALGVAGWVAAGARVADDVSRQVEGLVVTTPEAALRREDARAGAGAQRSTVLGAAAAVAVLGTAVLGGAALRRDHEAFVAALRRRGAGRGRRAAVLLGEVAATAAAGMVIGLVAGAVAAAVLALHRGQGWAGAGATAAWAVLASIAAVASLGAVSAALLAVTLTTPAGPGGTAPAWAWRAVEAGAVGCVAVGWLLAARGGVDPGAAGAGPDPLLAALPALALTAAALALARVWPATAVLGARLLPRRALAARLGTAAAAGRPLRPVVTAAVLTAAVAGAVFAGSYRATLEQGALDQAAFAVPGDARLAARAGARPLDLVTPQLLAERVPGATAYPVLRATASLRVTSAQGEPVAMVGLEPGALTRLPRREAVTGGPLPAGSSVPTADGGTALPAGRTLRILTPGEPVVLAVTVLVRAPDGRERNVPLRVVPAAPGRPAALEGTLPRLADRTGSPVPLRMVALALRQPTDSATRRQHALGESPRGLAEPTGRLALAVTTVDGAPVPAPWAGWSGPGLDVAGPGAAAVVAYRLDQGVLVLDGRPRAPGATGGPPLPVVTDPRTASAARDGLLTLVLARATVQARVVGVLPRLPTVDGRFAVADLTALGRLVDRVDPGAGQATELWLDAGPAGPQALATALGPAPFDRLDVSLRADVQERLSADPVARGATDLLTYGALVLLLVAAAAVVLLVAADRTDDAPQAYAWEADGVPPRTLRAALWWRAAVVVLPAVPAGVGAGLVLTGATARLVAVTATATVPSPPLRPAVDAAWAAAVVGGGVLLALGVAAVVAGRSMREDLPVRACGEHS